jgi:hypothetical protein
MIVRERDAMTRIVYVLYARVVTADADIVKMAQTNFLDFYGALSTIWSAPYGDKKVPSNIDR